MEGEETLRKVRQTRLKLLGSWRENEEETANELSKVWEFCRLVSRLFQDRHSEAISSHVFFVKAVLGAFLGASSYPEAPKSILET